MSAGWSMDVEWQATATWSLDCRSLSNPGLPAPDVFTVVMDVRVYRCEYPVGCGGKHPNDPVRGKGRSRPAPGDISEALIFGARCCKTLPVSVSLTAALSRGKLYTDWIRWI